MNIKKVKLFLVILLALLSITGIFVALIPAVYADTSTQSSLFSGGSGTSTNPYLISSIDNMEELAANVNEGESYDGKYFKLTEDLTYMESDEVTGLIYNVRHTQIGLHAGYPFKGNFNGDGHTIDGATIVVQDINNILYYGWFGYVDNATIENLQVSTLNITIANNVDIIGLLDIGGIVGYTINSTINNCSSDVTLTIAENTVFTDKSLNIGGIAGTSNDCNISNCLSSVEVDLEVELTTKLSRYSIAGVTTIDKTSDTSTIEKCITDKFNIDEILNCTKPGTGLITSTVANAGVNTTIEHVYKYVEESPYLGIEIQSMESNMNCRGPANSLGSQGGYYVYYWYDNGTSCPQLRSFMDWVRYNFSVNDSTMGTLRFSTNPSTAYTGGWVWALNATVSINTTNIKISDEAGTITITAVPTDVYLFDTWSGSGIGYTAYFKNWNDDASSTQTCALSFAAILKATDSWGMGQTWYVDSGSVLTVEEYNDGEYITVEYTATGSGICDSEGMPVEPVGFKVPYYATIYSYGITSGTSITSNLSITPNVYVPNIYTLMFDSISINDGTDAIYPTETSVVNGMIYGTPFEVSEGTIISGGINEDSNIIFYDFIDLNNNIYSVMYSVPNNYKIVSIGIADNSMSITRNITICPSVEEIVAYELTFSEVEGVESSGTGTYEVLEGTSITVYVSTENIYYEGYDLNGGLIAVMYDYDSTKFQPSSTIVDGDTIEITSDTIITPTFVAVCEVAFSFQEEKYNVPEGTEVYIDVYLDVENPFIDYSICMPSGAFHLISYFIPENYKYVSAGIENGAIITSDITITPIIEEIISFTITFEDVNVEGVSTTETGEYIVTEGTTVFVGIYEDVGIYHLMYEFNDINNTYRCIMYDYDPLMCQPISTGIDGNTLIISSNTTIKPEFISAINVSYRTYLEDENEYELLGSIKVGCGDDLSFNKKLLSVYHCQDFTNNFAFNIPDGYKFSHLEIIETESGNVADLTDVDCDITITAVFTK